MSKPEMILLSIMVIITICGAIYKFLEFRMIHRKEGKKGLLYRARRVLLAPIYFLHSYDCPVCGKVYFFSHNAHICCPGPHNEKWRAEHPDKKCLTGPGEMPPITPVVTWRDCPVCKGSGRINGVWCDECGGRGKWPG